MPRVSWRKANAMIEAGGEIQKPIPKTLRSLCLVWKQAARAGHRDRAWRECFAQSVLKIFTILPNRIRSRDAR
jgi:hypothetical protein